MSKFLGGLKASAAYARRWDISSHILTMAGHREMSDTQLVLPLALRFQNRQMRITRQGHGRGGVVMDVFHSEAFWRTMYS